MVDAIVQEIHLKKDLLKDIQTLYFGGGTPSILETHHFDSIFNALSKYLTLSSLKEVTLEANPDDITKDLLDYLKESPINRFSMGIQSFHDKDLSFMNRAHNSHEAFQAVEWIKEAGFDSISIDLIYGMPNSSLQDWRSNVQHAISLGINHISAYCLTIEEKTVLGNWHKKGKFNVLPDENVLDQFKFLVEVLQDSGYEHYELSNFAKEGKRALHNANYWKGLHYIGIGPSAHSYFDQKRTWNVANNTQYMNQIEEGSIPEEIEYLTDTDRFNEYLMVKLRTSDGIDKQELGDLFGKDKITYIQEIIDQEGFNAYFETDEQAFRLNFEGKFISDHIISSLFWVD